MQLHILSFEGPDPYARAGGIASRVVGLAQALAAAQHDAHLWQVGDPDLAPHERKGPHLHIHRWCQWISAHHPGGVYDGEEAKERDFAASLPPYLVREYLLPEVQKRGQAVVLAEEWHTVHAVLHLDWLLREAGIRDRVALFWNANNTFGFDRIDWPRLSRAATLTTVSRYMRQRMWAVGADPLVVPNGLPGDAYTRPAPGPLARMTQRLERRTVLAKVARWDPDKRWIHAVRCVAALRDLGARPLLVARGGIETHGREVLGVASALGLRIGERHLARPGAADLADALSQVDDLDVVVLQSHLDASARRVLFRGAEAVLANSAHEPFGLVGLETMAAGGVACTGGTGEDYAIPGVNALVLQSEDPRELLEQLRRLRREKDAARGLRAAARRSSRYYAWPEVVRSNLLPRLQLSSRPGATDPVPREPAGWWDPPGMPSSA